MFETLRTEIVTYAKINAEESKQRIKNHETTYTMATLEFIDSLHTYWKWWNDEHFDYVYNLICNKPDDYRNFLNLLDEALTVFKYTLYAE